MIYAANFKTNHTRQSTKEYISTLKSLIQKREDDKIIIFPPATALDRFDGDFVIGAQNAYAAANGAFTGEIGVAQLDEFSIKTILIGHSERRSLLNETQQTISEKFEFFKDMGFEILYCIGEPLHIRQSGDMAVAQYLLEQFEGIDVNYNKLTVAYEPIWAIGTGRSATSKEIALTHEMLKKSIQKPLLYGGSVKPENAKEILGIRGVDGVLVGSASLDPVNFSQIVKSTTT